MRRLGAMADRLLNLVVPQMSAAADHTPCTRCGVSLCYCSGGLRYSRLCSRCHIGGNTYIIYWSGCQVVGTC